MNCRKVRSYLSAYSDSSLSSDKHDELEVHIRNCKSCEREKLYIDEILAAAKTLPGKTLPDDFNLKLFNRIYAEQNSPTESYLPLREPSLLRRPISWITALATLSVAAVATLVFLNTKEVSREHIPYTPSYTEADNSAVTAVSSMAKSRHREPLNVYENAIGVSGASSNYRATDVAQVRTLHLADAKVESLKVEMMKRLGREYFPGMAGFVRSIDGRYYEFRSPYGRPPIPSSGLMRNASASY